jgi:uncharacterized membrane protein
MRKTEHRNGFATLSSLPWTPIATGCWLVSTGVRRGSLLGGVLAAAGGAVLYRAVARSAPDFMDRRPAFARGVMVKKAILVDSSPEECYRFWRDLENLSDFMDHIQSVRVVSETRSRWVAKAVGGTSIEWDAQIVKDVPGQMIGWRSLPGSALQIAGSVRFEPADGGAQVVVTFKYDPPAGKIGAVVAELFGESPSKRIGEELDRFKKLMEKKSYGNISSGSERHSDPVDRSSDDSFPASDPPSWAAART